MLGANYDRSRLQPLNPDGNTPSDSGFRTIGSHRGVYEALNTTNPHPNFHYLSTSTDRASVQRARNNGAVALKEGDEEVVAAQERLDLDGVGQHTPLDSTYRPFDDLIPMRMPIENYRRLCDEQQKLREANSRGSISEDGFVSGTDRNYGEGEMTDRTGRPTRFALSRHRSYVTEGTSPRNAEVDPQWAKVLGIARENG